MSWHNRIMKCDNCGKDHTDSQTHKVLHESKDRIIDYQFLCPKCYEIWFNLEYGVKK